MMPRWFMRIGWFVHKALRRLTGGRLGTERPHDGRVGTLFLHTTGHKTGQPRVNGLFYIDDGPDHVVVASNAGASKDPGWLLNLRTLPDAIVEVGGDQEPVRAREATADERAALWPKLVAAHPPYAGYDKTAGRPIPIVILEPRGNDQAT